jgi:hypothetical protein
MNEPLSILLCVASPSSGPELARVARSLAPTEEIRMAAVHLTDARHPEAAIDVNAEGHPLCPLVSSPDAEGIEPISFASADIGGDILRLAGERACDLLLLGWHAPVSSPEPYGEPVRTILAESPAAVGIYLARSFGPLRRVMVLPGTGANHAETLRLAGRLADMPEIEVTMVRCPDFPEEPPVSGATVRHIHLAGQDAIVHEIWSGYDLVLTGATEETGATSIVTQRDEAICFATAASVLVVRAPQRT